MAPVDDSGTGAEQARVAGFGQLADGLLEAGDWYRWGPYLSERQWGTVREDYSADGEAWTYFPHDHARSRAYRWGEDGMAGFSDIEQRLCLGLALWNGNDAILKERMFGLTGAEGNHGEDPKDYWWYLDSVPSHAWNRWRYHYPQSAFPYGDLVEENGRRGKHDPEYELLDTGAFDDDRYWVVEVDYVKADVDDIVMVVRATNAGADAATLHVLPTAWFRNTWSWEIDAVKPTLRRRGDGVVAIDHPIVGPMELVALPGPDGADPVALFCDNETNDRRVFGSASGPAHPKDGINDHVVSGAPTVNPDETGTKVSLWYQLDVAAGATAEVRLRLRPAGAPDIDVDAVIELRRREADEFYAALTPPDRPADEAMVMRQAFAGMLWGKQLYAYDVERWLAGDPGQPPPPASRRTARNARWTHFEAFDIMSMPDPWEYPWFAAWDLGFHCVALRPPRPGVRQVPAAAALPRMVPAPERRAARLRVGLRRRQPAGAGVGRAGGLRHRRSTGHRLPGAGVRQAARELHLVGQPRGRRRAPTCSKAASSASTTSARSTAPTSRSAAGSNSPTPRAGWRSTHSTMATIASVLNRSGTRSADDLVVKFLEHFAAIRRALEATGVWDDEDGFFYDQLIAPDGTISPVKVRSMVGVIPLLAAISIDQELIDRAKVLGKGVARLLDRFGGIDGLAEHGLVRGEAGKTRVLLGVTNVERLERVLARLFDPAEFLSPYGLRALSAWHRDHPYQLDVDGVRATIDYEPAESTTSMFGGNSNWRGPIWMPLNYLVIGAIERYGHFFGDELQIEYPTGSGVRMDLMAIAADLRQRLTALFTVGSDGRRPCFGQVDRLQHDPRWFDNIVFNEYFHGDDGAGLGATHQTGWTGLVADLIRGRPGDGVYASSDLGRVLRERHTT